MTNLQLYHTWYQHLQAQYGHLYKPQLRNLTWLCVGIHLSRSVQLHRIAGKIPSRAKLVSTTRRVSRTLEGLPLAVRPAYESVIRPLLTHLARTGQLRLLIDSSRVGFHHQLLLVSVAYRKRAIPVAWTWVRDKRGHSATRVQLALLDYVRRLVPADVQVSLAGDCEFGAMELLTQLEQWHWQYALRQKANHLLRADEQADWQRLSSLVSQPGESVWLTNIQLTARHQHRTNLLAYWATGEDAPWLLATNHDSTRATLHCYARRMWIEELFGDLKGHGFDLESTHLDDFRKLSRLTLVVALLYVWLVAVGVQVIKRGLRSWVDRADRRDLCVFQIGLRYLERCLTNHLAFRITFHLVI
jgi:hypothetical protein